MSLHSPSRSRAGQRRFNRLRLRTPAQLQLTHELRKCLIDDISSSGARLRVAPQLVTHQSALLLFHELKLFCTVMWCTATECGVRFDQPLDLENMQGMLWITENRELYVRICQEAHALAWAEGSE